MPEGNKEKFKTRIEGMPSHKIRELRLSVLDWKKSYIDLELQRRQEEGEVAELKNDIDRLKINLDDANKYKIWFIIATIAAVASAIAAWVK